jgi:hypothetical protein
MKNEWTARRERATPWWEEARPGDQGDPIEKPEARQPKARWKSGGCRVRKHAAPVATGGALR